MYVQRLGGNGGHPTPTPHPPSPLCVNKHSSSQPHPHPVDLIRPGPLITEEGFGLSPRALAGQGFRV